MYKNPYTSSGLGNVLRRCTSSIKRFARKGSAKNRVKLYLFAAALAVSFVCLFLFGKTKKAVSYRTEQSQPAVLDFAKPELAAEQVDKTYAEQDMQNDVLEIKEPPPAVAAKPDPATTLEEQPKVRDLPPSPSPTPKPKPVDLDAFVDFYMVEAKEYYGDFGYSSNHYNYTENDVYMLAQLIYGEARGESTKGKLAVANVVMNRVLSRGFPGNTIEAVIKAPNQFTGYSSSIRPNSSCFSAAKQVLEKEVWVLPQDIYYFHSNKSEGENWGSHRFYAKIGAHCFYRESYSGRKRNADIPPALYERIYKWPQYGCKPGKRVSRIQYMLNKLGYKVKADGYFGMTSKEALIEFQTKMGLEADGVAGPSTIRALIRKFGTEEYIKKYS